MKHKEDVLFKILAEPLVWFEKGVGILFIKVKNLKDKALRKWLQKDKIKKQRKLDKKEVLDKVERDQASIKVASYLLEKKDSINCIKSKDRFLEIQKNQEPTNTKEQEL